MISYEYQTFGRTIELGTNTDGTGLFVRTLKYGVWTDWTQLIGNSRQVIPTERLTDQRYIRRRMYRLLTDNFCPSA